jgi:hypothetical protein
MNLFNRYTQIILSTLFILWFQNAFCQENYIPGYIIRLNGDTLQGLLDYQNWKSNPEKIHFKIMPAQEKMGYTVADINGFGIPGDSYQSAVVQREIRAVNDYEPDRNPALQTMSDTVFLQVLVAGPKSLLYYRNMQGSRQFYIRQGPVCELLIYKKYMVSRDEVDKVIENRSFVSQLKAYLQDCPSIYSKQNSTVYTQQSLVKLFDSYYACSGNSMAFRKAEEKPRTRFTILAGGAVASLKIKGAEDYMAISDLTKSTNFTTGISFEILLPRNLYRVSVSNELIYTSYMVTGQWLNYSSEDSYVHSTSTLGASYVKMNNLFRYTYPVGKAEVFFDAGISSGLGLKFSNSRLAEIKYYYATDYYEFDAISEPNKYEFGMIAGLGCRYKNLSIEVRYEWGSGITNQKDLSSSTSRVYIFSGYSW